MVLIQRCWRLTRIFVYGILDRLYSLRWLIIIVNRHSAYLILQKLFHCKRWNLFNCLWSTQGRFCEQNQTIFFLAVLDCFDIRRLLRHFLFFKKVVDRRWSHWRRSVLSLLWTIIVYKLVLSPAHRFWRFLILHCEPWQEVSGRFSCCLILLRSVWLVLLNFLALFDDLLIGLYQTFTVEFEPLLRGRQ